MIPFDVRPLFRPLQENLILLLHSLSSDDWNKPTIAGNWHVKDVVSHRLDGDLRTLSIQRDHYFAETPPGSGDYVDMVKWLNQLNADWIQATNRISPSVLILLHELSGKHVTDYYESLDPADKAIFPVQWAGESESLNWMHLAREYSEKWHHQQQIRDATGKPGILTPEFYFPLIRTFLQGVPHVMGDIQAEENESIEISVYGKLEQSWFFTFHNSRWRDSDQAENVLSTLKLPADKAWKLFSKSIRPKDIQHEIKQSGRSDICERILTMVSVMA